MSIVLTRPGDGMGAPPRLLSMPDRKSVNSCSRGVRAEVVSQAISATLRFKLFSGRGGSTGPAQPIGDVVADATGEDTFTAAEGSARERRAPAWAAVGGLTAAAATPLPNGADAAPPPPAAAAAAGPPGVACGGRVSSWERSSFGRTELGELPSCASLGFFTAAAAAAATSPAAPASPGPFQKSLLPFLTLPSSSSASLAASTAKRGFGRPLVA